MRGKLYIFSSHSSGKFTVRASSHVAPIIFGLLQTVCVLLFSCKHWCACFKIPLLGYGGTSQLELEGAKKGAQRHHYWTDVGSVSPGQVKVINQMNMVNTGTRAAFVAVVPFRGKTLNPLLGRDACSLQPD